MSEEKCPACDDTGVVEYKNRSHWEKQRGYCVRCINGTFAKINYVIEKDKHKGD